MIDKITGFVKKALPFTYLGCPIFKERKKWEPLQPLINKELQKISSWKSRMLSLGDRLILIQLMLSSIPKYLITVCLLLKALSRHWIDALLICFGEHQNLARRHTLDFLGENLFSEEKNGLKISSLYDMKRMILVKYFVEARMVALVREANLSLWYDDWEGTKNESPTLVRWLPPHIGAFKLNTDRV
ncbi:hypothetical protein ACH5RR_018371 [Cinchona calisaya]|uniref:Reverse transcriptase n=1 Tax=Cinchona calisaya TaxID=153742 RepID=A0ABD2ZP35_9GENT